MTADEFTFLFRQGEGLIDRVVWRRWTLRIVALSLVASAIWSALAPYAHRDMADKTQSLFNAAAFFSFLYLLLFCAFLLLSQICQYYLTLKRLRARAMPSALAALWPLSAFLAGAVFWAEPRFFGVIPVWGPWLALAGAIGVWGWLFYELGLCAKNNVA